MYTLENSSLSDVSFASIFSQSMACLLFLLLSHYLTNSLKIYPEMGLLDYMEILYVLFEIYLLNIILHFNLFSIAYTYSYFPITACITYCSYVRLRAPYFTILCCFSHLLCFVYLLLTFYQYPGHLLISNTSSFINNGVKSCQKIRKPKI